MMRWANPVVAVVLAGAIAGPSPVSADEPGKRVLYIGVRGGHEYGNPPRFNKVHTSYGQPASGQITCTRTATGQALDSHLPWGLYDVDPTSCSGLTIDDPHPEDFEIVYVSQGYKVFRTHALVSPPSGVRQKKRNELVLSTTVVYETSKEPIVGVEVALFAVTPEGVRKRCDTVADSAGLASCKVQDRGFRDPDQVNGATKLGYSHDIRGGSAAGPVTITGP